MFQKSNRRLILGRGKRSSDWIVWKYFPSCQRCLLQLIPSFGWTDSSFWYSRLCDRKTIYRKRYVCTERPQSWLYRCQSHGTGSLFSYRRTPSSLSRRKDYRKRKNIPDDRTIFQLWPDGENTHSQRRRYFLFRKTYVSFYYVPNGSLARSNDDLWRKG